MSFVEPGPSDGMCPVNRPPDRGALAPTPVSSLRRPPVSLIASIAALGLAGAALAFDVVAIGVATAGENLVATVLAVAAIVVSVAAVALAILGLTVRGGTRVSRRLALAGVVFGLVANPFLVVAFLAAVSGW